MGQSMTESVGYDLRETLGTFLRQRTQSAKHLARILDCEPRTAEGYRAGMHWPQAKHWQLIARQWGRDALDCVFGSEIDDTNNKLAREERELERRLHEVRARRAQAVGPVESNADRRDAPDPECAGQLSLFEPTSWRK